MLLTKTCYRLSFTKVMYSFCSGRKPKPTSPVYSELMNYRQRIKFPKKYQKLKNLQTIFEQNRRENPQEEKPQAEDTQNKSENNRKKMIFLGIAAFTLLSMDFTQILKATRTQEAFELNDLDKIQSIELTTLYGVTSEQRQARKYQATITFKNGSKAMNEIVNPNAFLAYLEQKQKGRTQMIPVYFKESKNLAHKIYDHAFDILLHGGLIYYLIKMRFKLPTQFFFGDFRKGKIITPTAIKVRFDQVAGMQQAKKEVEEIVEFLKSSKDFKKMGARIPKGALLTGPPGTGKTMLAKACARQSNASFYSMSGSDFIEMYGGMGASRVRQLFSTAKLNAPSIIFIDEIDTIGSKRNSSYGNLQKDSTLNQLLVEMDGFNTDTNVIVMAATNRKQILDEALLRPGRFDRIIEIDLPDLEGRKEIFRVHLQPIKINPQNTLQEVAERLSTLTPGFSGADIANLCNEAAILAARREAQFVDKLDFQMASQRVMAGLEKKNLMTQETKKIVAYHQSGHAVVGWLSEGGDPVVKVTIIPRSKGSLGFAQYLPSQNKLQSRSALIDRMAIALGGRVSQDIFFGKVTVGAADDLQKVHAVGRAMVTKFGMSPIIGNVSFQSQGYINTYSDKTAREIDQQLFKLIATAQAKARKIISDNKDKIRQLSQLLIAKQTITNKQLEEIMGPRPFNVPSSKAA